MELVISFNSDGTVQSIYNEEMELDSLGINNIKRASHVEPEGNMWYVDLSPIDGPQLGPFNKRSEALKEEHKYINEQLKQRRI